MIRTFGLAVLLTLISAAPATADIIKIPGADTSAPDRFDHVRVDRVGSAKARTRLVLLPGGYAGAGEHQLLARDLVRRQPNLQVWIVANRYQNLEDRRFLDSGTAGDAFAYYLQGQPVDGFSFTPFDATSASWARQWGLSTKMKDVRRVIRRARTGGRRVVLGGHSFGGYETVAYAGWDFNGRPGWKGLSGLVLIDGGVPGLVKTAPSNACITEQLEIIATGSPFSDPAARNTPANCGQANGNSSTPWVATAISIIASRFALEAPNAPSALQPLLREPSFPVTNSALLGYLFDKTYNKTGLGYATARFGKLAATGDPRGWVNGQRGTVGRVAQSTVGSKLNGLAFYYPARLILDNQVAGTGNTPRSRRLGLRMFHIRSIPTPMLVFQTDESNGDVMRSARKLVQRSRIKKPVYVNAARQTSHLDPLVDLPKKNLLLKPLKRFLENRTAGRAKR
jgi:pimeloyl-ACP methyl ester carboxylesterase